MAVSTAARTVEVDLDRLEVACPPGYKAHDLAEALMKLRDNYMLVPMDPSEYDMPIAEDGTVTLLLERED